jgi:hypothetical protein
LLLLLFFIFTILMIIKSRNASFPLKDFQFIYRDLKGFSSFTLSGFFLIHQVDKSGKNKQRKINLKCDYQLRACVPPHHKL